MQGDNEVPRTNKEPVVEFEALAQELESAIAAIRQWELKTLTDPLLRDAVRAGINAVCIWVETLIRRQRGRREKEYDFLFIGRDQPWPTPTEGTQ